MRSRITSPRLRGEHRPPLAAVLTKERRNEASAIAQRRVRGTLRESNSVERPPHPALSPRAGRGRRRPSSLRAKESLLTLSDF